MCNATLCKLSFEKHHIPVSQRKLIHYFPLQKCGFTWKIIPIETRDKLKHAVVTNTSTSKHFMLVSLHHAGWDQYCFRPDKKNIMPQLFLFSTKLVVDVVTVVASEIVKCCFYCIHNLKIVLLVPIVLVPAHLIICNKSVHA